MIGLILGLIVTDPGDWLRDLEQHVPSGKANLNHL